MTLLLYLLQSLQKLFPLIRSNLRSSTKLTLNKRMSGNYGYRRKLCWSN